MAVIVVDQARYEPIAVAFVERMTRQVIKALARDAVIKISSNGLSDKDGSIVFDLLFIIFSELENRNGLAIGDSRYLAAMTFGVFSAGPSVPGPAISAEILLGSDQGVELHSSVSFEIIQAAAKDTAAELNN